jgi:serine/threonine protein kinase
MLPTNTILQGRYRILNLLGAGGMGAVYEALDERLQITVALKETHSTDDRLRRQFEQEAHLLAQLQHPALPRVSDHFVEGDRAFLVMQYISGNDVAAIIAQQPGPFPRNQVVAWADQLLDALVYLHSRDRQVIHRDIKPHNLKVTENGRIALLDFGLAKRHSHESTGVDSGISVFGYTRCYAPLEQIQNEGTSPQSDIYALGATLYHLLTGVKPADALARATALINGRPDPLRPANEIHGAVGHELTALLNRALAQNPDKRYRSAVEFREALRRLGRTSMKETVIETTSKVESCEAEHDGITVVRSARLLSTNAMPAQNKPAQRTKGALFAMALVLLLFGTGLLVAYYRDKETAAEFSTTAQLSNSVWDLAQSSVHSKRQKKTTDEIVTHFQNECQANQKTNPASHQSAGNKNAVSTLPVKVRNPAVAARGFQRAINIPKPPVFRPPGFLDDVSNPVVERVSNAGSRPVAHSQVLRSAEGIHVVKLSDGSTRVFRPGERITDDER